MISLLSLFVIALVSAALGKKILSKFKIDLHSYLEEFCFSIGIGLALLALLSFLLGIFGLLYRWLFRLLLLSLAVLCAKEMFALCRTSAENWRIFIGVRKSGLETFLLITIAIFLLFSLLGTLSPPVGWDELVYHLTVPKLFINNHSIYYMPDNFHYSFPLNIEMLYMFCMLVHNDITAKLIVFLFSCLVTICIYCLGRKFFSKRIGLYAATIFATMSYTALCSRYANIELGLAFYVLLSFYAFINWVHSKGNKMFFIASALVGFCLGIKYTGVAAGFLLATGIFYKLFLWEKKGLRALFGALFTMVLIAGVVGCPWYLKNYLDTGNPVYPAMSNIFGGKYLVYERAIISGGNLVKQLVRFPLFLWRINVNTQWMSSLGPFYLFFIPCLLFLRRNDRNIRIILGYGLACIIFYSLLAPEERWNSPRHFFPFIASLSIACAYCYEGLVSQDKFFKKVLNIFILFTISLTLLLHVSKTAVNIPVVFGLETKEQYLRKMINSYQATEYVNNNLDDTARILLIGDRSYYLEKPFISGPGYHGYIDYHSFKRPQEFLDRLEELGVTHILLNTIKEAKSGAFLKLLASNKDFLSPNNFMLLYEANEAYVYQVHY